MGKIVQYVQYLPSEFLAKGLLKITQNYGYLRYRSPHLFVLVHLVPHKLRLELHLGPLFLDILLDSILVDLGDLRG